MEMEGVITRSVVLTSSFLNTQQKIDRLLVVRRQVKCDWRL
jgi:hypothetical protein